MHPLQILTLNSPMGRASVTSEGCASASSERSSFSAAANSPSRLHQQQHAGPISDSHLSTFYIPPLKGFLHSVAVCHDLFLCCVSLSLCVHASGGSQRESNTKTETGRAKERHRDGRHRCEETQRWRQGTALLGGGCVEREPVVPPAFSSVLQRQKEGK